MHKLVVKGKYYVSINPVGSGAQWRRPIGQQIYSPLLLAFTYEEEVKWKASHTSNFLAMEASYSLPNNVAIITLQVLEDESVLLRLAHLYEILKVKEMSLSANQEKSKIKKLKWKILGKNLSDNVGVRGGPVDGNEMVVELGPMEIRTFLLEFQ
eukprot:Gb_36492 [translate_table: standard]